MKKLPIYPGLLEAPDEINKPEGNEILRREIAPEGLDPRHGNAESDPGEPQHNGTADVAETTEQCDPGRPHL